MQAIDGAGEIVKVGKGILKRKGKPPYSLSLESWWFFLYRHGGDPTFGKFMKGGSNHVRR